MVDPKEDNTVRGDGAKRQQRRRWPFALGGTILAIGILAAVWDWDWFRPLVAHEASAALGRSVTLQHVGLRLGRQAVLVADGVRIANPEDFPQDPPLASAKRLTVTINAIDLLRHRAVVVPDILVEQPYIVATQREDGSTNYLFPTVSPGSGGSGAKFGNLRIIGGQTHVVLARLRADFQVTIETHDTADTPEVVAEAKGTYARQPIEASFVGGTLLSRRDLPRHIVSASRLRTGRRALRSSAACRTHSTSPGPT
jgi:AsmA family protein